MAVFSFNNSLYSKKLLMKKCFLFLFLLLISLSSQAHLVKERTGDNGKKLSFIKNQGQWLSAVQYKAVIPGGSLFLTREGFVYNFYSVEDVTRLHDLRQKEQKNISREKVRMHAYKVNFDGADTHADVIAEDKRSFYHNYFLGKDESKWKGGVPLFGKVTYRSIYPNIDLTIYNMADQLKYDFVLAKGADVNNIILSFDGVMPVITAKGDLKLKTSVGDIIESAPYTYQVINGKKTTITSAYKKIAAGKIGFSLGNYNKEYPVIIDPSLIFATYSGSTSTTYGFCATYNNQGDLIDAGESFGPGWPVQTGSFQTTFGGSADIGIDRFSSNGTTLLHSTYLGGTSTDQPVSLICDNNLDLYVMGVTESTDFPVSQGCYDNTHNGQLDLTVTHFNNTFTGIVGSTYLGGSQTDCSYGPKGEIYLDQVNNIYIGAYSQSSDYPTTFGVVQTTFGGEEDGVVSILNNSCTNLIASTFLGGTKTDRITGIRKMPNGNVAVAGTSRSTDYPTTANVFQNTANGPNVENGTITVLDPTLTVNIASTYVHGPSTDGGTYIQFIDFDRQNNLYVYGASDTSFPIYPGVYSNAFGQTLLAKFPATLDSLIWSTRIGAASGSPSDAITPTAFLADNCGKLYLSGYGWGMNNYPTTPNAISTSPNGFWIAVFDADAASLIFGTFFGASGDHLDGGTSRFDKKGIIYHAVCCGSSSFPTTPTAAYPTRVGSGGYDIVGYKLDAESPSVVALNTASPGLTSCATPFTVSFTNQSQNAVTYYWDFGDGATDTAANPSHTFTTPGLYNVMFVAANPNTCNLFDTIYMSVQILGADFDVADIDTTICFTNGFIPVQLTVHAPTAGNNVQFEWLPNPAILSATNVPTVTIDPSIDTVFKVVVMDTIYGACSISDTGTVVIHAIEIGNYYALPDTTILFCPGEEFQLSATGNGTNLYSWIDLSGLNTLRDSTSAFPYIKPIGEYTSYVVHIFDATRTCFITDTVNAQQRPLIDLTAVSPFYVCIDDTITLSAAASSGLGGFSVTWKDILGGEPLDMLSGSNTLTPVIAPRESRQYIIELTPDDPEFCKNSDTVDVNLYPLPGLDAGPDETIRYGESIQLDAAGNGIFVWYPDSYLSSTSVNNPVTNTPETIKYYVEVTTEEGCRAIDSLTVRVTQLSFPTAFTPNGDGRNDKLKLIISNPFIELEKWIIVDRWGKEVFNTTDVNAGWDGTYDGTYAETGVYFYYLKYKIGRKSYSDKGDVTLIR